MKSNPYFESLIMNEVSVCIRKVDGGFIYEDETGTKIFTSLAKVMKFAKAKFLAKEVVKD